MKITKIAIATIAILLSATSLLAQDRKSISPSEMSSYVVSAKAGVVNVVEGQTSVTRVKALATPSLLISGDELLRGDSVKTGSTGRAEILLNPGCYLRLGEGSEFVFLFDGYTTNTIKLLRGSAIIEASALDASIRVETPKAKFEIVRAGLYRFNVGTDAKAEVAVRRGRVFVGNSTIKEGKRAVVDGDTAVIAKLKKQEVDELDNWSKERARALIATNSRLSNKGMRRSLGISLLYNSWIYDPFCRCYTFLPYTGGFGSPYGGTYAVCNPYWYNYYGPRYNNGGWPSDGNRGGQPSTGGGSGNGSSSGGAGSSGGGRGAVGGNQPPPTPSRTMGGGARSSERERPSPRRP
ncbi:MAG: FecR family protein [Acidobacteriota bacterium]